MNEYYNKSDFFVHKFYTYTGPNYYHNRQAIVFNLYLDPDGPNSSFYKDRVIEKFPSLNENFPDKVVNLFAEVCALVTKMDLNLFVGEFTIDYDEDEYVIALEYLDDRLSKEVVFFVSDWFNALNVDDKNFDFDGKYVELQEEFDKTLYGGPTIYSLIEGGFKKGIHVQYLWEENQFQWGYGKKQRRGRSTIFNTDGIKDTEFTTYKDMVGEFLDMLGFPTPKGKNCFDEDEIVEEAKRLGFPLVVKPVAGHKGIGVTTGIETMEEIKKAFNEIVDAADHGGDVFEGALVQQQIYGHDHRILTIGGKYAACLKRIPAYVIGDGQKSIKELIDIENQKEIRADTARSPLAKINLDKVMVDFLHLQGLTADSVPKEGQEIVLRRVANISAGGVSINVTKDIHPENIELVETIGTYFDVTCMGIDVLAKDISKSWRDGDFGIIEINAGPGVFMHLAPAEGGSIDIPEKIMEYHFGTAKGYDRIPIIVGNNISDNLILKLENQLKEYKQDLYSGSLRKDGVFLKDVYVTNNPDHDKNVQIILRNPKLDVAILNHTKDDIFDYGMLHEGSDIAIIDNADYAEEILMRDLFADGYLVEIVTSKKEESELQHIKLSKGEETLKEFDLEPTDNKEDKIFELLQPYLKDVLFKYDNYTMEEQPVMEIEIEKSETVQPEKEEEGIEH